MVAEVPTRREKNIRIALLLSERLIVVTAKVIFERYKIGEKPRQYEYSRGGEINTW
jgi:hypothetical protein